MRIGRERHNAKLERILATKEKQIEKKETTE
jgi:hypothetical protein